MKQTFSAIYLVLQIQLHLVELPRILCETNRFWTETANKFRYFVVAKPKKVHYASLALFSDTYSLRSLI
jgi:hypothetical protein